MWCFWSAKGGVGCTVAAVSAALRLARREQVLLVDLGGDAATVLGANDPPVNLVDWLDTPVPAPDGLARLEREVAPNLSLLGWGGRPVLDDWVQARRFDPERCELLASLLASDGRAVVVDVGRRPRPDAEAIALLGERIMALAGRSTMVSRACYLGLRGSADFPRPDGVVLVVEEGRALRSSDVVGAIGAPVLALRWDPAVARAVDAGLGRVRLPRVLRSVDLAEAHGVVA